MKILKWMGIIIQIKKADSIVQRTLDIRPLQMDIPTDSVSLAIGKKWTISMCAECYGADLGGQMFIDDPMIGTLYAPNLTSGEGGIGYYSDNNWLGALRHGVSATGRPLMIMPSQEYTKMRAEDVGGIIAYIKTVPPVDRTNGETAFKPFAKFLLSIGAFGDLFGADVIDHHAAIPENVIDQTPFDRGEYLTSITGCKGCHGSDLSGMASGDPNSPPAANLTSGGNLASWSYNDFSEFLKSGNTKEGKIIDNKFMPWKAYGKLPDEELESIFTYLKSLRPMEAAL